MEANHCMEIIRTNRIPTPPFIQEYSAASCFTIRPLLRLPRLKTYTNRSRTKSDLIVLLELDLQKQLTKQVGAQHLHKYTQQNIRRLNRSTQFFHRFKRPIRKLSTTSAYHDGQFFQNPTGQRFLSVTSTNNHLSYQAAQ